MPEGHTLRRLANDLSVAFAGGPVRVSSPQGRFGPDAALVDGQPVLGVISAGKHLFIEFPGDRFIHVHLWLIGKLYVRPGPAQPPVGQVRLRLQNERQYADLRGATACELVTGEQRTAVLARLGPDPLDPNADPIRAWDRIRRSKLPIGALLLYQAVFAGVGNVYRAEVLFRHRIHPLRPGRTLRVGQFQALWDDLVGLMQEGVLTGRIDTVHSRHTPEAMGRPPRVDDHGGEVYVYRRTGQPCVVCGAQGRTRELGGGNRFWCARCHATCRARGVG
jgi:formamidopyrimidine-DNA glycosylase